MSGGAEEAFAFIDRCTSAMAEKSASLGKTVSCKAGCFHCCKEPVIAERTEVEQMVNLIVDPTERRRVSVLTETWWNSFFNGRHNLAPPPIEQNGSDLARYRHSVIWCPLLKDGLCSQYAHRPISCRLHVAIGPWRKCADDKLRPSQKFVHSEQEPEIMETALGVLCENAAQAFFQFDHLGIWLGHFLLGKKERSNAAKDLIIKQTDPK